MASVGGEWTNPSDIMKKHLLQRHSSFHLTKKKSASGSAISRRHSFTLQPSSSQSNRSSQDDLPSSPDTPTSSLGTGAWKRKNPFGCTTAPNKSRRRSILDQNVTPTAVGQSDAFSPCESMTHDTFLGMGADSSVRQQQNKLLSALTLQEQKDFFSMSPKKESGACTQIVEKSVCTRQLCDVLKEKPVSSNVEIPNCETSAEHKVFSSPPVDWSLKTKVRVLLQGNVDSFKKVPGIDAKNVDSFVHHKLDDSQQWRDLDVMQQIKRCCMHYSYPHLPWLPMFPRLSSDFKSRSTSVFASSKDVVDSLQKDWSNTLTSVYQQLRAGLCPYFYVCAHQFTVLFRCLRSPDGASWSALLSPSTRGLREMLTKEGIEFTLPNIRSPSYRKSKRQGETRISSNWGSRHQEDTAVAGGSACPGAGSESLHKENNNSSDASGAHGNCNDDSSDDTDIHDDNEASQWLEGMGLDKKDFPSLEPFKVKLQREGFREIDNRPQSLVYVAGVDVHSFFNFLLNYSCIASSGPQHGIPPTLLSPVPFVGGRLVQNTVKHTTLTSRLPNASGPVNSLETKTTHVFEISGPVLPHHGLNMASLLHSSSDCDSASLSFSTHPPSAAFNTQPGDNTQKDKLASGLSKLFVDISQANPGLLQDVKNQILVSPVLETGTAVRDLHITKSGFSWVC